MDKTEACEHVPAGEPSNRTGLPAEVGDGAAAKVPSACRKPSVAAGREPGLLLRRKVCVQSEEASCYCPVRAPQSQTGFLLLPHPQNENTAFVPRTVQYDGFGEMRMRFG